MSSQQITLNYFPLRCRAETIRLVLHAARVNFTDKVIEFADWASIKPNTPFGSLPYVEIDGEAFGQGIAIATYFAREHDLYGRTNQDGLRIEQIQQLKEDLNVFEVDAWKEKDGAKSAELNKNMMETVYPRFMGHFERLVKENQTRTGSKFAVGDKLSLADITIMEGTQTLRQKDAAFLDNYPLVKALVELVADQEGIRQYLKQRPVMAL